MVRAATLEDIPALLEMGREFAGDAGVIDRTGWSDEAATNLLVFLVESDDGVLLRSDDGMIGGHVAPHPFNPATRMFVELFWKARDGNGRALLSAAEDAAKARGAIKSLMVGMDDMDRTKRLYARLGYEPIETHYMKELG